MHDRIETYTMRITNPHMVQAMSCSSGSTTWCVNIVLAKVLHFGTFVSLCLFLLKTDVRQQICLGALHCPVGVILYLLYEYPFVEDWAVINRFVTMVWLSLDDQACLSINIRQTVDANLQS